MGENIYVYIYIYTTISLCCVAEINTMLLVTYTLIKKEESFTSVKKEQHFYVQVQRKACVHILKLEESE